MKSLKVLLLVTFISFLASAMAHTQDRSVADATYALKGPVRSFKTEISTFVLKDGNYVEGPRVVQSEATFNTDGNRTDLYIYNKGLLARRIEMKYDGRKMTECINYDGAGNAYLRIVDSYDDDGRIKEEATYNGDGSLRSKTSFKRNTRGQLLESSEYSAGGVLMEHFTYKYEGEKVFSWERKIFRQDGILQVVEVYIAPNRKEMTKYRPDGSIAEKSVRIGHEIAFYNADGSLQKFTTISDQGRLLDELTVNQKEPSKRESQIPDSVDAQGNWTKQTKWSTAANGTHPLTVTYRAITYYEK
ncbi:MAG TPA: hypothetical protein VN844_12635 [Pyrinomonadaceae bacterium]|nr:hypothetical protein [Pyrinomonadaceae bacterium]